MNGSGSWPRTVEEALKEQDRLRPMVDTNVPGPAVVQIVAGLDAAYTSASNVAVAAVVVLDAASFDIVDSATAIVEVDFPYVPGLLAFRELPGLLAALDRLQRPPDMLVCDGHGLAHPRHFGLACHLGVVTGIPTFGVAKTAFFGAFAEPGNRRGDWSPLTDDQVLLGNVLRTQTDTRPVFVSPGHLIDVATSSREALRLASRYRLPEPIRLADQLSRRALQAYSFSVAP
jgi:deoxyribonuclease V